MVDFQIFEIVLTSAINGITNPVPEFIELKYNIIARVQRHRVRFCYSYCAFLIQINERKMNGYFM